MSVPTSAAARRTAVSFASICAGTPTTHDTIAETETAIAFLNPYPTSGVPLEQQQYHALMLENGVLDASCTDVVDYIARLRVALLI